MNWYKKTKQKEWGPFLNNLNIKRKKMRMEAENKGSKLGHVLEGWSTMESCYCRKCGAYAKINGVLTDHDGEIFYGSAFLNRCNVNFDTPPNFSKYENPNPKYTVI